MIVQYQKIPSVFAKTSSCKLSELLLSPQLHAQP